MDRGEEIWIQLSTEQKAQVLNGIPVSGLSEEDFALVQAWAAQSLQDLTSSEPFDLDAWKSSVENVTGGRLPSSRVPGGRAGLPRNPANPMTGAVGEAPTAVSETPGDSLDPQIALERGIRGLYVGLEEQAEEYRRQIVDLEKSIVGSDFVGYELSEEHAQLYMGLEAFVEKLNEQGSNISVEDIISNDDSISLTQVSLGNFNIPGTKTFSSGAALLRSLAEADLAEFEIAVNSSFQISEIDDVLDDVSKSVEASPELQEEASNIQRQIDRLELLVQPLESDIAELRASISEDDTGGAKSKPLSSSEQTELLYQNIAKYRDDERFDFSQPTERYFQAQKAFASSFEEVGAGESVQLGSESFYRDPESSQVEADSYNQGLPSRTSSERPDASAFGGFVTSERPDDSAFRTSTPRPVEELLPFDGDVDPNRTRFTGNVTGGPGGPGGPGIPVDAVTTVPGELTPRETLEVADAMSSMFGMSAAFWTLDSDKLMIGLDRNDRPVPPNSAEADRIVNVLTYIDDYKIESDALIKAAIEVTPWYQTTNASMRDFDTRYGGLNSFLGWNIENQKDELGDVYTLVEEGFKELGVTVSQDRIVEIAATIDYYGYELDNNEIYSAVMKEAKNVVNQFDSETAAFSEFATSRDAIESLARQYYLTLPSATIAGYAEDIFTQDTTLKRLESIFQEQASARFSDDGRVQNALNAGLTLAQYFAPYQGYLERELERPVDLFEEFPEVLEQMGDDGVGRSMTYAEMREFARSLPEWAETPKAQDAATEMVFSIGKLFGATA